MSIRSELDTAWAEWGRAQLVSKWRSQNPGEASKVDAYRAGGARPSLSTATGKALVAETAAWLLSAPVEPPPPPPPPPPAPSGRWYVSNSPWNTPIPASPAIHPNNQSMIAMFAKPWTQGGYGGNGGLMGMSIDWVPPVWEADASTPMVSVRIDYPSYGFASVQVPIPAGAKPALPLVSNGGEGHMMVWRTDTGDAWDFYKGRVDGGVWSALKVQKSNVVDGHSSNVLTGDGSQRNAPRASYTASGAGMVRQRDVQSGAPDFGHALAVSYKGNLSRGSGGIPVFPALDTDATGTNPQTDVPMGARFQLDPSLNVDSWPSLNSGPAGTAFHRALARTLQRYGMYVIDTNYNGPALVNENYLSLRGGYQWPTGFYEPLPYDLAPRFRVLDWR